MKDLIQELFDYQRFNGSGKLERLISQVGWKYGMDGNALSDDVLELVAAAGEPETGKIKVGRANADDNTKPPG